MMREADEPIFEKTRDWLQGKDLPSDSREESKTPHVFSILLSTNSTSIGERPVQK